MIAIKQDCSEITLGVVFLEMLVSWSENTFFAELNGLEAYSTGVRKVY